MSIKALTWAWDIGGLSPTQKLTLLAIADNANDTGFGFPSCKRIARFVELRRESVVRITHELEAKQLLTIIPRYRPDGGQTSNGYQLNMAVSGQPDPDDDDFPAEPETHPPCEENAPPPVTESNTPCDAQIAPPPVTPGSHTINQNIELPIKPRERAGTRLPEDWTLPLSWKQWAEEKRPDLNVEEVADIFKDHWLAHAGKEARKRDWFATWRNWVRRERPQVNPHEKNHRHYRSAASDNEQAIREFHERQARDRDAAASGGRVIKGDFQCVSG